MTRLFRSRHICYVTGRYGSGWLTCTLGRRHDGDHRDRDGIAFRVRRLTNRARITGRA